MNENDRRNILGNLNPLSRSIAYDELKKYCKERQLVTDIMINEIEKHNENGETKNARLLTKLTKRGPKAYLAFKDICWRHFPDAYKILDPHFPTHYGEYHNSGGSLTGRNPDLVPPPPNYHSKEQPSRVSAQHELKPYEEQVYPDKNLGPFQFSTRIHLHPKVATYNMRSKHRGVLFCVNIINFTQKDRTRKGAEMDRNNLISVFRKMDFTIFYYEDLLFSELEVLLDKLVNSHYLARTDCLVFTMMTHGSHQDGKEYVQFADGGHVNIREIISRFYNDKCDRLIGRPKVFILPYCRGDKPDRGVIPRVQTDGVVMKSTEQRNLSTKSDILLCYGTVQGFETHRDIIEGSWFVQELCSIFSSHAHNTDLEVMLKLIMGRLITEYRTDNMQLQTPSVESWGFHKALYFNPGYNP